MMGLLDAPDDSAIAKMMGILSQPPSVAQTPGGPAPAPPVPFAQAGITPAPGPQPTEAPSMVQRIHDRMSGLLSTISDHTRPATPAGYAGLLSPEEIEGARPSFLSSMAGDAAQHAGGAAGAYEEKLNNIVKMKELAAGISEHHRVMQARELMPQLFPEKPNETMDETRQRLGSMYAYLMSHGDEEGMKEVGSTLRGIMAVPRAPTTLQHVPGVGLVDVSDPKNPTVVMKGEKTPHIVNAQEGIFEQKDDGLYNAATGEKWTGGTIHPVPLAPSFTPQTISGPDGAPVVAPFNSKTGTMGSPVAQGKPTSKANSAQNMASEALLRSSASEMTKSDAAMREYEAKLANGSASINGVSQFLGGLGNAFTHDDPASRAIQNTALTTLNKTNPELARYIRRGLSFAEGEAGISKRPSDFRTKMATFLSTAASGASPEMISDIQSRRSSILTPINSVLNGSTPKGSGSVTGSSDRLSKYRHLLTP